MSKIPLDGSGQFLGDPSGAQVVIEIGSRAYLGDVAEGFYDDAGLARLSVRYFNGEPWPFTPLASAVDVLDRKEHP